MGERHEFHRSIDEPWPHRPAVTDVDRVDKIVSYGPYDRSCDRCQPRKLTSIRLAYRVLKESTIGLHRRSGSGRICLRLHAPPYDWSGVFMKRRFPSIDDVDKCPNDHIRSRTRRSDDR